MQQVVARRGRPALTPRSPASPARCLLIFWRILMQRMHPTTCVRRLPSQPPALTWGALQSRRSRPRRPPRGGCGRGARASPCGGGAGGGPGRCWRGTRPGTCARCDREVDNGAEAERRPQGGSRVGKAGEAAQLLLAQLHTSSMSQHISTAQRATPAGATRAQPVEPALPTTAFPTRLSGR